MKTKTWVLLIAILAMLCLCVEAYRLMNRSPADAALVYSEGKLIQTIQLNEDGEYRIGDKQHWNVLRVRDGEICVIEASCPSQDCVHRGYSDGASPIVCLPNKLVIEFSNDKGYDAVLH